MQGENKSARRAAHWRCGPASRLLRMIQKPRLPKQAAVGALLLLLLLPPTPLLCARGPRVSAPPSPSHPARHRCCCRRRMSLQTNPTLFVLVCPPSISSSAQQADQFTACRRRGPGSTSAACPHTPCRCTRWAPGPQGATGCCRSGPRSSRSRWRTCTRCRRRR